MIIMKWLLKRGRVSSLKGAKLIIPTPRLNSPPSKGKIEAEPKRRNMASLVPRLQVHPLLMVKRKRRNINLNTGMDIINIKLALNALE